MLLPKGMFLKDKHLGFFENSKLEEASPPKSVVTLQATYNSNGGMSKTMSIYQHKL